MLYVTIIIIQVTRNEENKTNNNGNSVARFAAVFDFP
jgi:hypothetical protein